MTACQNAPAQEALAPEAAKDEVQEKQEPAEEEYYEEEEYLPEEDLSEAIDESIDMDSSYEDMSPVGKWYTDGYDEESNWAMSYVIELTDDGKATCTGWRNKDTGTYTADGDHVTITFDDCQTDEAGEGWKPVEGFVYTVEMDLAGDEADITIDAPDVISNLDNGTLYRQAGKGGSGSGDAGEDADIADGEYITDETYIGDISEDGSTVTIETALYHYDDDWNPVLDYEEKTYVLPTSDNCKCVIYTEEKEESPVAEQIEFINEFLQGNSGLPITFKIKDNQLTEISFSS
ncbi:MAG: hypothetical protein K6F99_01890 [Lachnospiraceae bacterium]|nr:hypothetical protein [Lachnospiraceae bacterium]